ncbi:MAG: DUF4277 domain-containing protein, partial [Clostridia bacterium]|nr:DUF4277 domain-containing protein [Clostridia bacterium]
MLINILMGRTALYRVDEFYDLQDVPILFGAETVAEDFNDSVLGRTLDKVFDAVIVVILPDGVRALSESRLFPDKMFRALGVSPSVYVTIPRETLSP